LLTWEVDGGYRRDKLCGRLASSAVCAAQSLERKLPDLVLDLWIYLLYPSFLNLAQACEVAGGEGVLECETGGYADLRLRLLIGEFAGECDEVAGL